MPGLHKLHEELPLAEFHLPRAQLWHALACTLPYKGLNLPASHWTQAVKPDLLLNAPGRQRKHAVAPLARFEYQPA
jgi:hypothetical protein